MPLVPYQRFRLLGVSAIPVYLLAMYVRVSYEFFELTPLGFGDWGWVVLVTAAGYGTTLVSDMMTRAWEYRSAKVVRASNVRGEERSRPTANSTLWRSQRRRI